MKRWKTVSHNGGWLRPATILVSTVELPQFKGPGLDYKFETCVFGLKFDHAADKYDMAGGSDVVDRYDTLKEAVAGHAKICKEYGIN